MNGAQIDGKNNDFKYKQNSDRNKEFTKKSRLRSKSDSNLGLENRKAQISFNGQPKSKRMYWFEALHYKCKDVFLYIIERTIDPSNYSFEIFIPLRRVDRFLFEFVCRYISEFQAQFTEPCLANRFDLLKYKDQNTIPDCLTVNFKKAFILYSLVINADYKELFDKRLNECISRWQDSMFSFVVNDNGNFEFDCRGIKFVLDPNDTQHCYLISRFIESYFSNQALFDERRIHRFIHCEEGEVVEQTTIFINFLNIYQSYGNVSRIINHLFNDLTEYCNHYDIAVCRTALELLGILASGNSISIFKEHLAKTLNKLIPTMHGFAWEAEDENGQNSIMGPFLELIKLNLNNIKQIVFSSSEIRLQDNAISCLLALALKNLITKEFFEELIPHIISEFNNLKSLEQIRCLQLLNILAEDSIIHRKDELLLTTISSNFVPPFVKIVNENKLPLDVVETTLSFLGLFITRNLISQSEVQSLVCLFVKMLTDPEESAWPLQSILFHLGYLVKTNLVSQEAAEKFLLPVRKALDNGDANIKINALCIFVNLVTANLITVKRVVELFKNFKLKEKEIDSFPVSLQNLYTQNQRALLELMPIVIPMFNRDNAGYFVINLFEELFKFWRVSSTITGQLLSFVIEFVEQKVIEFNKSVSLHCFKALVFEANSITIEEILSPLFNHPSIEVQEMGLLCLQYFNQYKQIPTQIIDKHLPFIIKTIVNVQEKIYLTALEVLQFFSDRYLISKDVIEPQLPAIILMLTNSKNEVQKIGFQCLNMLIAAEAITESQGKQLWNLLVTLLDNSEFTLFEEVLLLLKNCLLYKLISVEDTVIKQVSYIISMMQKTVQTFESTAFDFLEVSIKKRFIDNNIVETQFIPWVLEILRDSTLNEKRNALVLLNQLIKGNLISKESIKKLVLRLKIALKNPDLCIKRNVLLFVSSLVKSNENYIELAVSILSDFTLQEQEALEFLDFLEDKDNSAISMIVELSHLLFLFVGANGGRSIQKKVEKALFDKKVCSLAYEGNGHEMFQNQYLLFLREMVGQDILKNYNYTFELFTRLFAIEDKFKKIAFPMFDDSRPLVKEYICLLIEYFAKERYKFENIANESFPRLITTIGHPEQAAQNAAIGVLKNFIENKLLSQGLVEEQLPSIISMIENSESQVQQGGLGCLRLLNQFVSPSNAEKLSHIILLKFNNFQIAQQNEAIILLTGFIQEKLISSEIALEKYLYVVQMIGSSKGKECNIAIAFLEALIEADYLSEQLVKTQLLPVVEKILLNDKNLDIKMNALRALHEVIKANLVAKSEIGSLILTMKKSFNYCFLGVLHANTITSCLTALVSLADAESISPVHEEALCSLSATIVDQRKGVSTKDLLLFRVLYSIRKLIDVLMNKKLISKASINYLTKLDLDFYEIEKKTDLKRQLNSSSKVESNIKADDRLIKLKENKNEVNSVNKLGIISRYGSIAKVEQGHVNEINANAVFKYILYLLVFFGIYHSINYTFNSDK